MTCTFVSAIDGRKCGRLASVGSELCYVHNPERADEVRKNAKKASAARGGGFQKGDDPRRNGGGSPVRARLGFSEYILANTNEGRELVDYALDLVRDFDAPRGERLRALEFLTERALGKAPLSIEGEVGLRPVQARPDLSRLSDDELEAYEAIAAKIVPHALPAPEAE
jgi:hypothetical protein